MGGLRVVFFGSGAFGLPTLERLAERHVVAAVVTQPDRPAGRGGGLTPTPVGAWAAQRPGLMVLKPERVGSAAKEIRGLEAGAWVVIAYGQKLPAGLLEGRLAINLHASLLPRWRGAGPIQAAMLAGDTTTGNSVIALAERMDAGVIYGQSRMAIDPAWTAGELHDRLAADGPGLVDGVLEGLAAGRIEGRAQDESGVTLAPKLSKADGWVDFAAPAVACRSRVHGLTPWPGVTVRHRGEPLRLLRVAEAEGGAGGGPGRVVEAASGLVACGEGVLRLVTVQPAGRTAMPWRDYANGRRVVNGELLEGGPGSGSGTGAGARADA